ncbi:CRISPR-associated endonuclease Cas1 [Desulfurobacterium atlanticum]|uniref:CRISPR-associated endonuclease Cas1 n=1 Tax=Desulfurobacterium atlanticum TaxID=240169 RepID=A0A238XWL3_9BACT|nr:CRISPR-associated endonuclease Cas1 [Desulfurobacterium atlanticum]SNR63080.1 CRISPR-associated endonuclease Cas1 [Desulfurobacterium atlanticum]
MRNIFVTTHGASLTKRKYELIVTLNSKKHTIPFGSFSNLFIVANVKISTPLIKALTENKKSVFILKSNGTLTSMILPPFLNSSARRRVAQYKKFEDESIKIFMIKELLRRKSLLTQWTLEKFYDFSEKHYLEKNIIKSFYRCTKDWIEKSSSIAALRGIDGYIMNTLYDHFAQSISKFWEFEKRSYNPPKNEVNSVLSLVYTYTYSILTSIIISYNLDPYCGFFHEKHGKHAVLASDLLELLRPGLIFFVADILNSRYIEATDFKKTRKSILIKQPALKVISKLYSEKVLNGSFFYPVSAFIHEIMLRGL